MPDVPPPAFGNRRGGKKLLFFYCGVVTEAWRWHLLPLPYFKPPRLPWEPPTKPPSLRGMFWTTYPLAYFAHKPSQTHTHSQQRVSVEGNQRVNRKHKGNKRREEELLWKEGVSSRDRKKSKFLKHIGYTFSMELKKIFIFIWNKW